jgi:hypothetical protein
MMIKFTIVLRRRPGMTREEFVQHHRERLANPEHTNYTDFRSHGT